MRFEAAMATGAYNYVVTAHKPTAVTACATGNYIICLIEHVMKLIEE